MSELFAAAQTVWHAVPVGVWVGMVIVWDFCAVVFLLLQRRPPVTTLAWIIGFLSLPFIGAAVYFFFGPRKLKRRRLRRTLAKELAARFAPDAQAQMPATLADRVWLTSLARLASSAGGDAPPRPSQSLRLFAGGDETYTAIEAAVQQARYQVHMEYYIFEPDVIGTRLRDAMIERARSGVAVRVLVDALGSSNAKPAFWRPLVEAGGEVREFNPPKLLKLKPGKLNFRTHRKIVVIDGVHAFTGGINVSAGNSSMSSGGTAWRDTHLEFRGAPAQDLQVVFLEDWLYSGIESGTAAMDQLTRAELESHSGEWFPEQSEGKGPWVQIIDSGPDEASADIHRYFFAAIASARRRLWITTPYFVPDEPILMALITAAARGVDVRIIVPQEGDSKLVTAAASTFADEVAAEGVAVFEYQDRMIHAKTMVVDDELAIVGTANLDNRSFRLNFEVIAAIYDREVTAQLAQLFEQDLVHCKPIDAQRSRGPIWDRLLASAARLFAPLL